LEITLARLAKLVGRKNFGSPVLLDTHRPDAFRLKRFSIAGPRRKGAERKPASRKRECVLGFRVFRPPWRAEVQLIKGQPVRINARGANSFNRVRGKIGCASGPWRASGDWWRADVWARDEWDVVVSDDGNQTGEVLCRIFFDRTTEEWFVAGIYD
jgi:protein ImuB